MSNAWEVTLNDIEHVISIHGKSLDEVDALLVDAIDHDRIIKALLYYTNFPDQVECMNSEIEDILIENDVLDGPKLFHYPR